MRAWNCIGKLSADATLWNTFNAIERELAFLATAGVLFLYQGGQTFRPGNLLTAPRSGLLGKPVES